MVDISNCKSLNDICAVLNYKKNYTNREKVKKYLFENGIDWVEWLKEKKNKHNFCLNCGKEILGKDRLRKKFCNSACSASYNNKNRKKISNKVKIKISKKLRSKKNSHSERSDINLKSYLNNEKRYCLNCKRELNSTQKRFCSNKCHLEYKSNNYIQSWKEGKENGINGDYGISNYIRNYLLKKNDYKCEKCGWGEINEFTNKVPLEVHHIDGDYSNNKEENLQLLCPNCHSLTNTYKSHNKKGRKKRNKKF